MGIRFFAISQPFGDQSCWNFSWEFKKLLSIDCWYEINVMALNNSFRFRFLGPFLAGKWAWPPRWRLRVSGQKSSTKKLAHVEVLLGRMLSQNHTPEISDPGPPFKQKRTNQTEARICRGMCDITIFTIYRDKPRFFQISAKNRVLLTLSAINCDILNYITRYFI